MQPPPKLQPGDRVAIVSPSWAAPAHFPAGHELGMWRVRDELGLEPVEYPTTRQAGAPAADRARDLMAAYADPSVRAVFATIGGSDQITVLRHLDPAPFRADPKPYFGYSDNTNLLNWLWFHDVAAYHGGSTQVHMGRGGRTDPVSLRSLRAALFEHTDLELSAAPEIAEEDRDWADPSVLDTEPPLSAGGEWTWVRADRVVSGPTWGGNLEILHWTLAVSRYIRPVEDYRDHVLLLETSEEMPSGTAISRMLRDMGERGLLEQFPAAVIGRAKATSREHVRAPAERAEYRAEQQQAIRDAFDVYNPDALLVFDVDFGHTDPQWVLPYGGRMTVDGPARRLTAHY